MEARRKQLEAMLSVCTDPSRKKWLEELISALPAPTVPLQEAA